MKTRGFHPFLSTIGVLRHPCDLDLLLFFHRHPRSLLTSEQLAAYVGYDLAQVGRSLDLLDKTGLLTRSQRPARDVRLYVLVTPEAGWLAALVGIAATREGRRDLVDAMRVASAPATTKDRSSAAAWPADRGRRRKIC